MECPFEKLIVAHLVKKLPLFMEPKGLFNFSQIPHIGPYPDPHESGQHPHILFLEDTF